MPPRRHGELVLVVFVAVVAARTQRAGPLKKTRWSVGATMSLWREGDRCEDMDAVPGAKYVPRRETLVVALASDSAELLPSLAVTNSTATHGRNASVVVITTRKQAMLALARRVRAQLPPTLRLRICDGLEDVLRRRPALAALRGLTTRNQNVTLRRVRRPELLSPFNFAAFYLPHCLLFADEILYLDTDVIVRDDVVFSGASQKISKPIAAVEDCSQKLGKYVNFSLLRKLLLKHPYSNDDDDDETVNAAVERFGLRTLRRTSLSTSVVGKQQLVDEDTCVFNRGVVLFEAKRWRDLSLSALIEALVFSYVKSKAKLWRGGVSQPPFLIALAGRYKKLPLEWNVRGLGRVDLGRNELQNLEVVVAARSNDKRRRFEESPSSSSSANTSLALLKTNLSKIAHFDKFSPFVAPLAHRAHVLHFTGEVKPWRVPRHAAHRPDLFGVAVTASGHVASDCLLKQTLVLAQNFSSTTHFFSSGCYAKLPLCALPSDKGGLTVASCAAVWHSYVSDDARAIARSLVVVEQQEQPDDQRKHPHQQRRRHHRGGVPPRRAPIFGRPPPDQQHPFDVH